MQEERVDLHGAGGVEGVGVGGLDATGCEDCEGGCELKWGGGGEKGGLGGLEGDRGTGERGCRQCRYSWYGG